MRLQTYVQSELGLTVVMKPNKEGRETAYEAKIIGGG